MEKEVETECEIGGSQSERQKQSASTAAGVKPTNKDTDDRQQSLATQSPTRDNNN